MGCCDSYCKCWPLRTGNNVDDCLQKTLGKRQAIQTPVVTAALQMSVGG